MPQDKRVKKLSTRRWWKVIIGAVLAIAGIFFMLIYAQNNMNYAMAILCVLTLGPSIYLLISGFKGGESGFVFKPTGQKITGNENALIWCAKRNGDKDIPTNLLFLHIPARKIPTGARPKYLRNIKRHVYELIFDTVDKKIKPVILPDKKNFSPELFKIPATMQPVKDYLDYNPPSMLQKLAPGIIILAMVVVGILMVMTNS